MKNIFEICEIILANKKKAETLDKLGEVTTETIPSDKNGYDWVVYSVNGIEVRKEYVSNGSALGTDSENAIPFVEGMSIAPNTYYSYDGKVYVYMGVATDNAVWENVVDSMAEWYE